MKKQDLKDGYTVVYRNGEKRRFKNGDFFNNGMRKNNIMNYSDDLLHVVSDGLDIMSVMLDDITIWTREKEELKPINMKEQLKDGYTVVYRDGNARTVNGDELHHNGQSWNNLRHYKENLTHNTKHNGNDIVSIRDENDIEIWKRSAGDVWVNVGEVKQEEIESKMQAQSEDRKAEYKEKKEQGSYHFKDSISLLQSLPESVQIEIVRALSDEDKRKLVGL